MKQITTGTSNTFVCTLAEKQTLTAPYWLFRFVKDGTNQEATALIADASDTSGYKVRFNRFTITEGTTVTLSTGIWTYYVYEQISNSNTNYVNSTTLCETGQVKVSSVVGDQIFSAPDYSFQYSESTQ